ncbi:hypothetical protein, partial [Pseudomonas viridiflava]|uniref:hypothetical protein n=1 Tax=Pseudomonas viridiflava TaxID=33069 RepID=UPI00197FC433
CSDGVSGRVASEDGLKSLRFRHRAVGQQTPNCGRGLARDDGMSVAEMAPEKPNRRQAASHKNRDFQQVCAGLVDGRLILSGNPARR